jgi:hypothetical protein
MIPGLALRPDRQLLKKTAKSDSKPNLRHEHSFKLAYVSVIATRLYALIALIEHVVGHALVAKAGAP